VGEKTSRLRQALAETQESERQVLEAVLAEQGPLLRGTFGRRRRVCGTAGCRCTRGELHESAILTAGVEGRMRQVHVPASDEARVAEGVERYRRFRQAKTRLIDLAKRKIMLVDRLGQALLAPYPKDRPLPPPKRFLRGERHKRRRSE
jgi:hypothetical protein